MSDSIIKDVYVGEYVLVQMVDTTVELTVANNVYSLTEATELEQDLLQALYTLRKEKILKDIDYAESYSEEMQDQLEPIDE
jgi:hypothetical protein